MVDFMTTKNTKITKVGHELDFGLIFRFLFVSFVLFVVISTSIT